MAERKAVTIYVGDAKSLVAASAEAKAAIKSVQDQASKKSGLDRFPTLGGNITTSLAAAVPVVVGLSGALGGLAASATAAAGGAGAVGAGGLGALAVGLGSIALVAKPAADSFKKVTTALDAYNLTLAKHGTTAKQAAAAQTKLNAVVGQNGGAPVLAAAKAWDSLGESFQKLTGPATATMFKTLNDGLKTAKDLLPTVAGIANKSMAALSKALQVPLKMLASAEFKGILKSLGDTFAKSIGPSVKAASLIFLAFSRIAQAAGPYVVELAKGIERVAQGFADATKNPTKLNGIIGVLVSNTKSWLKLTTAVGRLIFDVFKQGVSSGQGMVDSLTQIVGKWDAWVTSASGSQAVQNFFRESAQFARELFSALGPILQAVSAMSVGALPVYVSLMSKFKDILGPLTYGLVAYKAALTIATAATKTAQALGGKPLFGGAVATVPSAAAAPTTATGALGSIRTGASSLVTRGAQGLMIGTVGTIASQAIGAAIHGAAGAAVKAIGTDVSIGAGFGSIFGPAGMAGGALIGGLVGSVTTFITSHVGDEGKKFAAAFTAPLPDAIRKSTTAGIAKAANNISDTKFQKVLDTHTPGFAGGDNPRADAQARADQAKIQKQYFQLGWTAGNATIAGLKSVRDPSTSILLSDFTMQLKKLPEQAQPAAAKAMLSFAIGLQQAGKIPYAGLQSIIKGLEGQIPGFSAYLANQGQVINQVFNRTLALGPATNTLRNTLAGYRKQFGDWVIDTKITGQNIDQNISTAMAHLQTVVATSSGKTRKDALAEYNKLHDQAVDVFNSMGDKVQASIKSMGTAIKDGSASAAKVAAQNLGDFASNVGTAMNNGVLSVGQGMKLIIDNTNKALKEMGQKQLSPIQVGAMTLGTAKQRNLKAGGGYIGNPGEKGRDNVPIVVGRGEAILNHDQQRVVNGALSAVGIGGLPSLFSKRTTPHYMASGGIAGGALSYGQLEGLWDSAGGPKSVASTAAAIALAESGGRDVMQQGQPFATTGWGYWQITPGGAQYLDPMTNARAAVSKYRGAGNTFQPWTTFNDGAFRQFLKGGVSPLGGIGNIAAPKVSGSGVMATIAHAAMGILAKGANAFLGSKVPTGGATGFGGASSGPGGLASFEGVTMAKWIANELSWATKHGWHGQPTSGYRPGFDPHAPGGSEHALINYPGGAVDFGGMTGDPAAYATKLALVNLAARLNYPGPRLKMPIGFRDDGHLSGTGHAKGGFVGSFKNGGVAPRDGFAYVHKGETMIPAFAKGGVTKGQGINSILTAAASFLYPLDEALAALAAKIAGLSAKGAPNHNPEIAKLTDLLAVIAREKINPPAASNASVIAGLQGRVADIHQQRLNVPAGKAGNAERKKLAEETLAIEKQIAALKKGDKNTAAERRTALANRALTIENKIKELKEGDKSAKTSLADTIKGLNIQVKNLTQIKSYTDAITSLRTQMQGLAQQAAQAWAQVQTNKINAAHDAALKAIAGGADSTTLAGMQAQDTVSQNAATLSGLQDTLSSDQALAAHSGGQTHLDALKQVKADQAAIDAFNRQQTENQLQANIDAATKKADDAQTIALNGLDAQTTDYQNGLDAQFAALTDNLNKRKLTYAQWAKDVDAILAPYGLSAATDPSTEQTVVTGPGTATVKKPTHTIVINRGARPTGFGGHRAGGGPVQPGYVYRVGEQGPEDVVFGRNGTVMTAAQTRAGGASVVIHNAHFTGTRAAKAFADRLSYRAAIGVA